MQHIVLPSILTVMPKCEGCGERNASRVLMEVTTGTIWVACPVCADHWKPPSAVIATLAREIE